MFRSFFDAHRDLPEDLQSPKPPPDDVRLRALMFGYLRGERSSFEKLFDRMEPELRAYLTTLVSSPASQGRIRDRMRRTER